MSEEKLTVAELMARAGKEGQSTDAPRRRRRRSLEDGGISVAELTGSIPAVKEKPAESKHSAVKIDDPVAPQVPETPAARPEAPAQPEPATPETPVQQDTPAEEDLPAQPDTPATPDASATPEPKVDTPQAEKPAKATTARTIPSNEETMVLSIVDEKDPIRLTTGAFPVVPSAAVKKTTPKPVPVATDDAESAADVEFASATVEDQPVASPAETTQMAAITGDIAVGGEEDAENSGKLSVFSVILMAIVGVVLGAAVFLAFEMLWERLANWLVGLLAIAVTLGMVGIVHALRTSRDGFSMVLAAIVGLVMTFGPLLIVL